MILIVAVDDRNGMTFNHRRQSQDKRLRERILSMTKNGKLWMNAYSHKQFVGFEDNRTDSGSRGFFWRKQEKRITASLKIWKLRISVIRLKNNIV